MTINQDEVSRINHQRRSLPENDDRISAEKPINDHENPAAEGEIPEMNGDVAPLPSLGGDPLNDETRGEQCLSRESENGQQIPVP
jgi:hypothetical protein